jgi:hypothetical protein
MWKAVILMRHIRQAQIFQVIRTLTALAAVLFVSVAFTSTALADDPIVVKSGGKYFFLRKDANGAPVTTPVPVVIDMDQAGPGPGPNPPGNPDTPIPPAADPIATAVKAKAIATGEPNIAKGLAVLYGEIAKRVRSGEIKPDDAVTALNLGYKEVLKQMGGTSDRWKPVIEEIESQAATLIQNGQLDSAAQWADFIAAVGKGLDSAAEGAAIEDILAIIKLVMTIINLIFNKGGDNGDFPDFGGGTSLMDSASALTDGMV